MPCGGHLGVSVVQVHSVVERDCEGTSQAVTTITGLISVITGSELAASDLQSSRVTESYM